jgi:Gluconate 2-dehydrogenase subunit 3
MTSITRREAIKRAALLIGGSIAIPDILKAWESPLLGAPNAFFTAGQAELIAEIAETIVPKTKTPGAKEAGVPAFIQMIISETYEPEDRAKFIAGLEAVDAYTKEKFGRSAGFVAATAAERTEVLKKMEADFMADRTANPWWGRMKDLAVVGYFTSEIGVTQALRYEPVPGRYDGAYPYKKGDRAWA